MASAADLRLPSIDGLRAFEAAARLGSFERAAGELHVTASAVGKRVATLEALLGQPLFTRQGKALALTAGGREYLDQVRSALALLSAMPQHRRTAQRRHRLRVCAPPTFARLVLVPELPDFCRAHADVDLELVLSVPFLDLNPGDAQVEVRTGASVPGGRLLLADQVLPMAAPALLQASPLPAAPADLLRLPLLRTPIEPWTPWLRAAGLDAPEPDQGPRLVDLGLTLEAALCGQGVVLGRPSLARHALAEGRLLPLFGPLVPATQRYHVLAPGPDTAAQAFADWLVQRCAQVAGEAHALVQAALDRGSGAARTTFRQRSGRAR